MDKTNITLKLKKTPNTETKTIAKNTEHTETNTNAKNTLYRNAECKTVHELDFLKKNVFKHICTLFVHIFFLCGHCDEFLV